LVVPVAGSPADGPMAVQILLEPARTQLGPGTPRPSTPRFVSPGCGESPRHAKRPDDQFGTVAACVAALHDPNLSTTVLAGG
jgi:hypothetical protein